MTGLVDGVPLAEAVRDAAEAVEEDGYLSVGAGLAAYGVVSAAKDVVEDPLGSIFAAGFGWAIEHNPILRTALDAVSGDPDAIESVTDAWKDEVATPLAKVAQSVVNAGESTSNGWAGEAGDAYRAATTELAGHSEALGTAARAAATGLSAAGTLVVEVRTYIRDELSTFLGWLTAGYAIAAASATPTGGGSVATFINTAILRGAALGQKFAGVLRRLADKLERFTDRLGALGKAADALRRAAVKVDDSAARVIGRTSPEVVSGRISGELVSRWSNAAPSLPTAGDVAKDGGTVVAKAVGDAWKTWSGTAPA
ncbi:hypothetical protein [Tsukamurella pseudospumae]|uniref:Outer membrane channel protein CpnT-like N-terminal domain-containing protein n=1 Tax=Tsukamurella pseudospumae TaxID=239498 RepID=A0A137YZ71_9ACTN|nr:hypothetical protein [Tsukamurella pseudospumae]KXO91239.1 hypothetical protein AXK61_06675 [Tsukamurella pseudospumae]